MKQHGTLYACDTLEFYSSLSSKLPYMLFNVIQDDVAGCFEYYAGLAEGLDAKQKAPVSLPMETFKSHVLKEPIGVVGLITPWYFSFPLLIVYAFLFYLLTV